MRERLRQRWTWTRKKLGAAAGAIVAALIALCASANTAVQTVDEPRALATAVGPDYHANLIVWADRIEEVPIEFDEDNHADLVRWQADLPVLPDFAIPTAPVMNWRPPYVSAIASGSRPLRYCLTEVRQFDAQHGTRIMDYTAPTIRALWDDLFQGVSSVEDCGSPDLILGASAAQDCGSAGAWGCAWFDGRRTRVTFNGELRTSGQMTDRHIQCSIWGHEILHALDLGHTGHYGGEGQPHPHVSSLGYVGHDGCPVDNPRGLPPIQDYEDGAGGYRYNLTRRVDPTPTPTPTPSPRPTPTATPTPTPTPSPSPAPTDSPAPQLRILHQRWSHRSQDATCEAPFGDGDWCVENVRPDGTHRAFGPGGGWIISILVRPDGSLDFEAFGGFRRFGESR